MDIREFLSTEVDVRSCPCCTAFLYQYQSIFCITCIDVILVPHGLDKQCNSVTCIWTYKINCFLFLFYRTNIYCLENSIDLDLTWIFLDIVTFSFIVYKTWHCIYERKISSNLDIWTDPLNCLFHNPKLTQNSPLYTHLTQILHKERKITGI